MNISRNIASTMASVLTLLLCCSSALPAQEKSETDVFQAFGAIAVPLPQEKIIAPGWYQSRLQARDSSAVIGYHVYRKEQGLTWHRITEKPVRMAEKEQFYQKFGEKIFSAMIDGAMLEKVNELSSQSILYSSMSPDDKVWTFLENNTDPSELGFLQVATELYPYWGFIYLDTTAVPGVEYQYAVRPVYVDREGDILLKGSLALSTVPLLPTAILAVEGAFKKKDIKLEIEYFPRPQMRSVQVYRLEEGKEPLLIAQESTIEPSFTTPRAELTLYDEGVEQGKLYRYKVYGADEWGNLSTPFYSEEIFALDPSQDYYVTNATFSALGDEGIEWSWENDFRYSYYSQMRIYKAAAFDGTYQLVATVPYHQLRWRDTAIPPETQYYYRFQRVYINGDTSLRSPYFTAVFELLQSPLPPTDITPTATKEGIALAWKRPADKYSPLSYFVLRSTDGENYFQLGTVDSSTYFFLDTASTLYPYSEVLYQIRPINVSLVVGEPSQAVAVFPYLDTLTLEPAAVWNVFINDDDKVQVNISDYTNVYPYIAGYNIYRRRKGTAYADATKINDTLLSTTSFLDHFAQYDEEYMYSYSLTDSRGLESSRSQERSLLVTAKQRVYPPMGRVSLEYLADSIELRWQQVPHRNLTGYIILRAEGKEGYREAARIDPEVTSWSEYIPRKKVIRYKVLPVFGGVTGEAATEITALR